jgi:hypothetical protein
MAREPTPQECGDEEASPGSGGTWRHGIPPQVPRNMAACQEPTPQEGGVKEAGPRVRGHADAQEPT